MDDELIKVHSNEMDKIWETKMAELWSDMKPPFSSVICNMNSIETEMFKSLCLNAFQAKIAGSFLEMYEECYKAKLLGESGFEKKKETDPMVG